MKSDSWNDLSVRQKYQIGSKLFVSSRGWLLIRQALFMSAKILKDKGSEADLSNAEDMEILLQTVFALDATSRMQLHLPEGNGHE